MKKMYNEHKGALQALSALGVVGVVALFSVPAFATGSTDPDGGATVTALGQLQTFFTGSIAPAIFLIVVAVAAVLMGIHWLRKGAKAGG